MENCCGMCNLFLKGELEVMKKAIISGIVFSSILLVGCSDEQNEEQGQTQSLVDEVEIDTNEINNRCKHKINF